MNAREYVLLLRRSWIVLLALTLIGAGAGLGLALVQHETYTSTAKTYVAVAGSDISELTAGAAYSQQVVASLADIATTAYVLGPVVEALHLGVAPATLAKQVTVTAAPDEAVLDIDAIAGTPTMAARIANAVAERLSGAVAALTPEQRAGAVVLKVTRVDPAVPAASATSPRPGTYLVAGAAAGLLLAVVLAVLRASLDVRVRRPSDLASMAQEPMLGVIPRDGDPGRRIVDEAQAATPYAESYRSMRSALEFLAVDEPIRSLVLTSSVPGEGKTTVATNLAIALADLGRRVVLVDADLRRPGAADALGLDGTVGLSDVLIGRVRLLDALQPWRGDHLSVLTAGSRAPNPNELLQSQAMGDLVATLEGRFDVVVFDAPPLLPVTDAAVLARLADGAIVVAAVDRARKPDLELALGRLDQARAHVLGTVLTMMPVRSAEARLYGLQGYEAQAPVPWFRRLRNPLAGRDGAEAAP